MISNYRTKAAFYNFCTFGSNLSETDPEKDYDLQRQQQLQQQQQSLISGRVSTDVNKIIEPLAIWHHDRGCSCNVCLNIILLFIFVIPSIIHAIYYCYMRD
ncbi:unnamed protein product [Gongylonema pulchrum]|uniref:Uncharacterized protein n=1 Tax=Gongylonema pulchrum TaxID=637853 RepID=A0A183DV23_9BILA|nr:unnamed protein product [Gongylonema pulchrum]